MKTLIVLATLLIVTYAQPSPRPTPARAEFRVDFYGRLAMISEYNMSKMEDQLAKLTEEVDTFEGHNEENGKAKREILHKIEELVSSLKLATSIDIDKMLRGNVEYNLFDLALKKRFEAILVHFKTMNDDLSALMERLNGL